MKIAIGIPTLNRADLLAELLTDLVSRVSSENQIFLLDNGSQDIEIPEKLKKQLTFIPERKNIGVAASWNTMAALAFERDFTHILLLNDDIVLGKPIDAIKEILINNQDPFLLIGPYFWSVFVISKECFQKVGGFDETFFPAYFEDNDYYRRIVLYGEQVNRVRIAESEFLRPTVERNSMTIKKDKTVNNNFSANRKYFIEKWGGPPTKETFKTPFNK